MADDNEPTGFTKTPVTLPYHGNDLSAEEAKDDMRCLHKFMNPFNIDGAMSSKAQALTQQPKPWTTLHDEFKRPKGNTCESYGFYGIPSDASEDLQLESVSDTHNAEVSPKTDAEAAASKHASVIDATANVEAEPVIEDSPMDDDDTTMNPPQPVLPQATPTTPALTPKPKSKATPRSAPPKTPTGSTRGAEAGQQAEVPSGQSKDGTKRKKAKTAEVIQARAGPAKAMAKKNPFAMQDFESLKQYTPEDNEAETAAYLGYEWRADYRRFTHSEPFLDSIVAFDYAGTPTRNDLQGMFYILKEFEEEGWAKQPQTIEEAKMKWPFELQEQAGTGKRRIPLTSDKSDMKRRQIRFVAWLLMYLINKTKAWTQKSDQDKDDTTAGAKQRYEHAIGKKLHPTLQGSQIKVAPKWTHEKDVHPVAEQYNRAYQYLRAFNRMCNAGGAEKYPGENHAKFWANKKCLDERHTVANRKPGWMDPNSSASGDLHKKMNATHAPEPVLNRRVLLLQWDKEQNDKQCAGSSAYENGSSEFAKKTPFPQSCFINESAHMNLARLRDDIRKQLKLHESAAKVRLSALSLVHETTGKVLHLNPPPSVIVEATGDEILGMVNGDDHNKTFKFMLKFHEGDDDDEDDEWEDFEYDGVLDNTCSLEFIHTDSEYTIQLPERVVTAVVQSAAPATTAEVAEAVIEPAAPATTAKVAEAVIEPAATTAATEEQQLQQLQAHVDVLASARPKLSPEDEAKRTKLLTNSKLNYREFCSPTDRIKSFEERGENADWFGKHKDTVGTETGRKSMQESQIQSVLAWYGQEFKGAKKGKDEKNVTNDRTKAELKKMSKEGRQKLGKEDNKALIRQDKELSSMLQQKIEERTVKAAGGVIEALKAQAPVECDDSTAAEKTFSLQFHAEKFDKGTGEEVGPAVNAACILLDAKPNGHFHTRDHDQPEYSIGILEDKCTAEFLAHQLTGAVWMLMHRDGESVNLPDEHMKKKAVEEILANLQKYATFGGVIRDEPGFGKSLTVLLDLLLYATYGKGTPLEGGGFEYRCSQILAENVALMNQWVDFIKAHFKGINAIVAAGSSEPKDEYKRARFVGREKMLAAIAAREKFDNDMRAWKQDPSGDRPQLETGCEILNKALDTSNREAMTYVIFTTYDTNRARSLLRQVVKCEHGKWAGNPKDAPPEDINSGLNSQQEIYECDISQKWEWIDAEKAVKEKHRKSEGWWRCQYTCGQKNWFSNVYLDEGQKIRHSDILAFSAVEWQDPEYSWIISGTPTVNTQKDNVSILKLIWPKVQSYLMNHRDQTVCDWFDKMLKKLDGEGRKWKLLKEIEGLKLGDPKRLLALNPKIIEDLYKTGNAESYFLGQATQYGPLMEQILHLKRNRATEIPIDGKGKTLALNKMLPQKVVRTVTLTYNSEEEAEVLLWHFAWSKVYQFELKMAGANAPEEGYEDDHNMPNLTRANRMLTLLSTSPHLCDFNLALDYETKVENEFDSLRHQSHDAIWFFMECKKYLKRPPETLEQMMRWLCRGSPKIRYLLRYFKEYILNSPEKLLICEQVPLNAWFIELVLNTLHIRARTVTSSLEDHERSKLFSEFKDKDSELEVLILLYPVSASGMNLHNCCYRVICFTPSSSMAMQIQAMDRPNRIDQDEDVVYVTNLVVLNSHDTTLVARQMNKERITLALNLAKPEILELGVELYNYFLSDIKEAHNRPEAEEELAIMRQAVTDPDAPFDPVDPDPPSEPPVPRTKGAAKSKATNADAPSKPSAKQSRRTAKSKGSKEQPPSGPSASRSKRAGKAKAVDPREAELYAEIDPEIDQEEADKESKRKRARKHDEGEELFDPTLQPPEEKVKGPKYPPLPVSSALLVNYNAHVEGKKLVSGMKKDNMDKFWKVLEDANLPLRDLLKFNPDYEINAKDITNEPAVAARVLDLANRALFGAKMESLQTSVFVSYKALYGGKKLASQLKRIEKANLNFTGADYKRYYNETGGTFANIEVKRQRRELVGAKPATRLPYTEAEAGNDFEEDSDRESEYNEKDYHGRSEPYAHDKTSELGIASGRAARTRIQTIIADPDVVAAWNLHFEKDDAMLAAEAAAQDDEEDADDEADGDNSEDEDEPATKKRGKEAPKPAAPSPSPPVAGPSSKKQGKRAVR